MTPVDQQQVDRVLAVIDALKVITKALETIHEIDAWRASMSFDKAPLLEVSESPPVVPEPVVTEPIVAEDKPCLPTNGRTVPTGPQWAYEIKHDGSGFI